MPNSTTDKKLLQLKQILKTKQSYKNFLDMHKKLKMPGSYRKGLVIKDNKIIRLIINYHETSPDKFSDDLQTLYYAGRGKKGKDYSRIEDQINNEEYRKENMALIKSKQLIPIYAQFWFTNKAYYLGKFKYKSHVIKKNGAIRYYYIKLVKV